MKLVRCEKIKGHFYDSEKYESCPHCGGKEKKPVMSVPVMTKEELKQKYAAETSALSEETVLLDETVMLDEAMLPDNDVTAALSGYTTEEIADENSVDTDCGHCELVFANGEKNALKSGHNSIGVGIDGCDVNIAACEGTLAGVHADIVCSGDHSEITPLGAGRVYLNGYYLMTSCRLTSGDKLTIGGAVCSFIDNETI